jgi:hypothetical protein
MRTLICTLLLVALVAYSEAYPRRNRNRDDNQSDRHEERGQYNCNDDPDGGPCFAAFTRWYHDSESGECREFTWGGCEGNGNKFSSKSVCERHCIQRSGSRGQPSQLPTDDDEPQVRPQHVSSGRHRGSGGEGEGRRQPSRGHPSRRTTPLPIPCDARPMCMMYCENGFKKGPDGCDVCQCN